MNVRNTFMAKTFLFRLFSRRNDKAEIRVYGAYRRKFVPGYQSIGLGKLRLDFASPEFIAPLCIGIYREFGPDQVRKSEQEIAEISYY
jgi:hypothetical protein